jgi:hypothetical protein
VKVGDLIRSTGPSAPDLAIILEIVSKWFIRFMWIDNNEIDSSNKNLFEVINEVDV